MVHLIDKDALVAEIEKRQDRITKGIFSIPLTGRDRAFATFEYEILGKIKEFIDTLEVKEVPEWKRATEDKLIGCLVWDEQRHFHLYNDRVFKGELYISMGDILELPNSPIKNKYDRENTENP